MHRSSRPARLSSFVLSTAAMFLLLSISVALPTPAHAVPTQEDPNPQAESDALEEPEAEPAVPVEPGDVLAVGVGSADGYAIMVPADADGWRTVALLRVEGMETSRWVGNLCVTGDGSTVAATFAPAEFANDPVLMDQGAFAAMVDLAGASVTTLDRRVSMYYHSPGCGIGASAAFTIHPERDQASTQIVVVDPSSAPTFEVTVAGQLTSAIPSGDGVLAAADEQIVEVSGDGTSSTLAVTDGRAYDLHPSSDGGVDYLVTGVDDDSARASHASPEGAVTELAHGPLRELALVGGRNGDNRLVGTVEGVAADSGIDVIESDERPDAVSIDGSAVVEDVATRPAVDEDPADAAAATGGDLVTITTLDASAGFTVANDVAPGSSASREGEEPAPVGVPALAAANFTNPVCAVPRNDPTIQAMQPTAEQVEWAANQAVRGTLTVARPQNWMQNGLPAYTPEQLFGEPTLQGGGRIPVQVLLGVLAQESNLSQASWGALPGVPGNPLVGNYYGAVMQTNDGVTRIVAMDFDNADCGYGIGQITDHMRLADPFYSAMKKKVIATDYAANILVASTMLADKWNELRTAGVILNDGDPAKIENWNLALWTYNSGYHHPGEPGVPAGIYGVGWTNNPANGSYPPFREGFLRTTYADAAHPADWPYQERIMGWAETAFVDYTGTPAYARTEHYTQLAPRFAFCEVNKNECNPEYVPANPKLGYCTRDDRRCWWHDPKSWVQGGAYTYELSTYVVGAPEPLTLEPRVHPPSCSPGASPTVQTPAEQTSLESTAVIVDDVPGTVPNLVGCSGAPSTGQFDLAFNTDSQGSPFSKIDFHQIGAGYNGHFWYAHTVDPNRQSFTVTGTWTPPASVTGWQRIYVHIPDHGADTFMADYKIKLNATDTTGHHRMVNQRWNKNVWVDLGSFNLGAGANVSLSNATYKDHELARPIDIAWDAVAFVPSVKPRVSYVALGDSYSAGEGQEPYYANSDVGKNTPGYVNACHRAPTGWPVQVNSGLRTRFPGQNEFHFIACSGSVIKHISPEDGSKPLSWGEPPQLEQGWIDENTTHVTLSIGGNDSRFAAVLVGCILTATYCLSPEYNLTWSPGSGEPNVVDSQPLIVTEPQTIDQQRDRLRALLLKIRAKAPSAKILLMGYPHVVSTPPVVGVGCAPGLIDPLEASWFADMGDRLNVRMSEAVADTGDANIVFTNPKDEFIGHEACSPPGMEWIHAIIVQSDSGSGLVRPGSGSFHPKVQGMPTYTTKALNTLPAIK